MRNLLFVSLHTRAVLRLLPPSRSQVVDLRTNFTRCSYGGMPFASLHESVLPGFLASFERVLAGKEGKAGRAYLAGDKLTLADFAMHEVRAAVQREGTQWLREARMAARVTRWCVPLAVVARVTGWRGLCAGVVFCAVGRLSAGAPYSSPMGGALAFLGARAVTAVSRVQRTAV
jgi:hypothetical protein